MARILILASSVLLFGCVSQSAAGTCSIKPGKSIGKSGKSVGKTQSAQECLKQVQSKQPTANGFTWYGQYRHCIAIFGATSIGPAKFKSEACIFSPLPGLPDKNADYVLGEVGKDGCPEGFHLIWNKKTCEAASKILGLDWRGFAKDITKPDSVCHVFGTYRPQRTRISKEHGGKEKWVCQKDGLKAIW